MKFKFTLAVATFVMFADSGSAGPLRNRFRRSEPTALPSYQSYAAVPVSSNDTVATGDALAEVNAARARRGLRPFIRDDGLTAAAESAAAFRAAHRIAGHTNNDFAFLPPGSSASAAGCGALEPSWGWGTCLTYENRTYAGAAVVVRGGIRYMHLFVR